jgi:hypothetical protein
MHLTFSFSTMDLYRIDEAQASRSALCNPQAKVMDYIESTLNKVLEDIQIRPCGRPSIILRRITDVRPPLSSNHLSDELEVTYKDMTISFPGKNKDEAWRFSQSIAAFESMGNLISP